MKKTVLILVVLLMALMVWGMLQSGNVSIKVNGQELAGPARYAAGGWGILLSAVVLFCISILLIFVFTGVGLVVLGLLLFAALIMAVIAFPFMLPLLLPLFVVWAFVAGVRKGRSANIETEKQVNK